MRKKYQTEGHLHHHFLQTLPGWIGPLAEVMDMGNCCATWEKPVKEKICTKTHHCTTVFITVTLCKFRHITSEPCKSGAVPQEHHRHATRGASSGEEVITIDCWGSLSDCWGSGWLHCINKIKSIGQTELAPLTLWWLLYCRKWDQKKIEGISCSN